MIKGRRKTLIKKFTQLNNFALRN